MNRFTDGMLVRFNRFSSTIIPAMRRRILLPLLFFACIHSAHSQTGSADCSNPLFNGSSECRNTDQTSQTTPGVQQTQVPDTTTTQRTPDNQQIYVDSAGSDTRRRTQNDTQSQDRFPLDPITSFQRLARASTGESLQIFGRDLFDRAPSTFAPADRIPVKSDYVVGPGDEVLVRLWGPETFNSQLTVDTTGSIYIPKVGAIHVAGLRFDQLQPQIASSVNRIYRNYNLSVDLGHLRSIQVYVVGEARRPGAYTISSLSTALNALFVSGGPTVQGSLRHIQVRRANQPPAELDLYDLLLRGDKSKDIPLEQGDTLFIPAAGPQVALAGDIRHPAIYEIRDTTTLPEVLQYAGGFTPTASTERVSLERIDPDHTRRALSVTVDAEGRSMLLRDGDVLFVNHIEAAYQKSVTIRGNLANPGRFPWHAGMRLSEIIPDRTSLLTTDYWRERNRLGVPVPLFQPMEQNDRSFYPDRFRNPAFQQQQLPQQSNSLNNQFTTTTNDQQDALNSQALRASANALALQNSQLPSTTNSASQTSNPDATGNNNATNTNGQPLNLNDRRFTRLQHRIDVPVPEIDWSYAVIERLDATTLKSTLVPFNLGKLVQDRDPDQNLELQPGDIVTILSQADIPVPLDEQTKFIRLEGEFVSAGVYSARPNETLDELVARAGGISPKAYLYGSSFLRESARIFQQQRLDEYISTLAADMERAAAVRAASSSTGILDPNTLAEQRTLIAQLRQLRATGRVVLEFQPASIAGADIPRIPLENGDVFRIPSRPNTVSVLGAVYGQNVFLYNANRRVEDYIALAGKPNRIADRKHSFIIRADGSIYSHDRARGIWTNKFNSARINPGDSIVIPEKLIKPSALKQFTDYTQILSSFGLTAAAINVITR